MTSNRLSIKCSGFLILLGIIIGIASIVPSIESERFLNEVHTNSTQVLIGGIFQFFLIPIYIGFSLLLYPLLKIHNPSLAIGFIGFRFMAGTFQLIGLLLLPVFILLSQKYVTATTPDLELYESAGTTLRLLRDLINHLGVILATGLGNLLLYKLFYTQQLIPNWLSIWGLLANILIMVAGFAFLFGWIEIISPVYGFLSIPLVFQEITLAIWLIVKGIQSN